jgi:hypothetical protein
VSTGNRGRPSAARKTKAVKRVSKTVGVVCDRAKRDMEAVLDSSSKGTGEDIERMSVGTDVIVDSVSKNSDDGRDRFVSSRNDNSVEIRNMDIPKFSGEIGEDVEVWIQRMLATHGTCEQGELLRLLMHALSDVTEICIQTNQ